MAQQNELQPPLVSFYNMNSLPYVHTPWTHRHDCRKHQFVRLTSLRPTPTRFRSPRQRLWNLRYLCNICQHLMNSWPIMHNIQYLQRNKWVVLRENSFKPWDYVVHPVFFLNPSHSNPQRKKWKDTLYIPRWKNNLSNHISLSSLHLHADALNQIKKLATHNYLLNLKCSLVTLPAQHSLPAWTTQHSFANPWKSKFLGCFSHSLANDFQHSLRQDMKITSQNPRCTSLPLLLISLYHLIFLPIWFPDSL